jgi:phosphatidylserine/phosphatidylglycerophosphate/cardiolipin synthase-like enzyme
MEEQAPSNFSKERWAASYNPESHVMFHARQQWCGSSVHSNTLIFDDECAVIGTVNDDDRGYTFDTEIVACITDDPLGRAGGQRFARDLRVNLWHKRLAVPHARLSDWNAAMKFW